MSDYKWSRGQASPRFASAARSEPQPIHSASARPVLRAEIEKLERERARPKPEATLTPGGPTEQFVHEREARRRERAIRRGRERLRETKGKARSGFDRGR
jgi:hypothetical protein